jgi:hypothetical protein
MQRIAQRGLVWIIALALVVAGLPMAHAMPDAMPMQHHAEMAPTTSVEDSHHHHDDLVMDAASDRDDDGQPQSSAPCKCLNCGMCVASFAAAPMRLSTPERRVVAVTYRIAAAGIPGIAGRVDPGIPILAV